MATAVLPRAFRGVQFQGARACDRGLRFRKPGYSHRIRQYHRRHHSILIAVSNAMREVHQDKTRTALAQQATGWVKPLAMLAGGIINGRGAEADVDYIMTH
jgi:hypothetical protein